MRNHINMKVPSCFVLSQCTGDRDAMCSYCLAKYPNEETNPVQEVLAPLKSNGYRMWLPELLEADEHPIDDDDTLQCEAEFVSKDEMEVFEVLLLPPRCLCCGVPIHLLFVGQPDVRFHV